MRDVGAQLSWNFGKAVPVTITAGLFNGSGLTNQKDFWTDNINFSAKAEVELPYGFNVVLSTQKIRPDQPRRNISTRPTRTTHSATSIPSTASSATVSPSATAARRSSPYRRSCVTIR